MSEGSGHTVATVRYLGRDELSGVERVLCEAFRDYPVMRFVLGPATADYERRLHILMKLFVMARVLRGETMLGVDAGTDLGAVAIVSDPSGPPSPESFVRLREEVWADLGADARSRYEAFGDACTPLLPTVPRLHLNMIGVIPGLQRQGLSSSLLEEVQSLSRGRPGSLGVSLTTEKEANLGLYKHFGYEVTGHAVVGSGLETWALFRSN